MAFHVEGGDAFSVGFLSLMGLGAASFGVWMSITGYQTSRLRADLTPEALQLVAHAGRHLALTRGLAEATIPWTEIQGMSTMRALNPNTKTGAQTTYILYTRRGDFTLNDVQWNNLDQLVREILQRTGRKMGDVAAERSDTRSQVEAGKRRLSGVERMVGWIVIWVSAPLLVLIVVAAFVSGFQASLVNGAVVLGMALSMGLAMIRFYRK